MRLNKVNILRALGASKSILRTFLGNRAGAAGSVILISLFLMTVIGKWYAPYDPIIKVFGPYKRPSSEHLLGTDNFGRDVFAQLIMAIQLSFTIGAIASLAGTVIGALFGFTSGYFSGITGIVLGSVIDIFLVIPVYPILVLIAASVSRLNIIQMAAIISLFSWAWPARQVRSQTLSLKGRDFIYIAKLSGMKDFEIILTEVMPHMLQWMSANFVNGMLGAILSEAGLSILGLGAQNAMTIGMMFYWIINRQAVFLNYWWWWTAPIAALVSMFLSLYLLSTAIDQIANPRQRKEG